MPRAVSAARADHRRVGTMNVCGCVPAEQVRPLPRCPQAWLGELKAYPCCAALIKERGDVLAGEDVNRASEGAIPDAVVLHAASEAWFAPMSGSAH
jgi:hypothetical protein